MVDCSPGLFASERERRPITPRHIPDPPEFFCLGEQGEDRPDLKSLVSESPGVRDCGLSYQSTSHMAGTQKAISLMSRYTRCIEQIESQATKHKKNKKAKIKMDVK